MFFHTHLLLTFIIAGSSLVNAGKKGKGGSPECVMIDSCKTNRLKFGKGGFHTLRSMIPKAYEVPTLCRKKVGYESCMAEFDIANCSKNYAQYEARFTQIALDAICSNKGDLRRSQCATKKPLRLRASQEVERSCQEKFRDAFKNLFRVEEALRCSLALRVVNCVITAMDQACGPHYKAVYDHIKQDFGSNCLENFHFAEQVFTNVIEPAKLTALGVRVRY